MKQLIEDRQKIFDEILMLLKDLHESQMQILKQFEQDTKQLNDIINSL